MVREDSPWEGAGDYQLGLLTGFMSFSVCFPPGRHFGQTSNVAIAATHDPQAWIDGTLNRPSQHVTREAAFTDLVD